MESFAISFVLDVGRVVVTHLNYRNYTQIQIIVFTGGLHGFSSAFFLKLESNRFLGNKYFTVTVNISNSLICNWFCYFEVLIINKSFIVQLTSWSEWRMGVGWHTPLLTIVFQWFWRSHTWIQNKCLTFICRLTKNLFYLYIPNLYQFFWSVQ